MTTETKRDSLPILKDRVSLSPELMKPKTLTITPMDFLNIAREDYLIHLPMLCRHTGFKLKRGKDVRQREWANLMGTILWTYQRDLHMSLKRNLKISLTRNTITFKEGE